MPKENIILPDKSVHRDGALTKTTYSLGKFKDAKNKTAEKMAAKNYLCREFLFFFLSNLYS